MFDGKIYENGFIAFDNDPTSNGMASLTQELFPTSTSILAVLGINLVASSNETHISWRVTSGL